MKGFLVLVVALILYGSLYPWHYHPTPPGQSLFHTLLHTWPSKFGRDEADSILVNILLYIPVGLFCFFALDRSTLHRYRYLAPPLLAFLLSLLIEILQFYDVSRDSSLFDVMNNTMGGIVGAAIGLVLRQSMSGSILQVLYWLGFQLCVVFGIATGRRKVGSLGHTPIEIISSLAAWCLVLYVLAARKTRVVSIVLAAGFTLLLIIRGLAPFHLSEHRSGFNWIPFDAVLHLEWIVGLPIFFEKSFYYGATIWLLHEAGLRLRTSTLGVAALLAAIEAIQLYLPGRTSESTDPIMALILGLSFWLIELDAQRTQRQLDILQVRS